MELVQVAFVACCVAVLCGAPACAVQLDTAAMASAQPQSLPVSNGDPQPAAYQQMEPKPEEPAEGPPPKVPKPNLGALLEKPPSWASPVVYNHHQPVAAPDLNLDQPPDPYTNPNPFPLGIPAVQPELGKPVTEENYVPPMSLPEVPQTPTYLETREAVTTQAAAAVQRAAELEEGRETRALERAVGSIQQPIKISGPVLGQTHGSASSRYRPSRWQVVGQGGTARVVSSLDAAGGQKAKTVGTLVARVKGSMRAVTVKGQKKKKCGCPCSASARFRQIMAGTAAARVECECDKKKKKTCEEESSEEEEEEGEEEGEETAGGSKGKTISILLTPSGGVKGVEQSSDSASGSAEEEEEEEKAGKKSDSKGGKATRGADENEELRKKEERHGRKEHGKASKLRKEEHQRMGKEGAELPEFNEAAFKAHGGSPSAALKQEGEAKAQKRRLLKVKSVIQRRQQYEQQKEEQGVKRNRRATRLRKARYLEREAKKDKTLQAKERALVGSKGQKQVDQEEEKEEKEEKEKKEEKKEEEEEKGKAKGKEDSQGDKEAALEKEDESDEKEIKAIEKKGAHSNQAAAGDCGQGASNKDELLEAAVRCLQHGKQAEGGEPGRHAGGDGHEGGKDRGKGQHHASKGKGHGDAAKGGGNENEVKKEEEKKVEEDEKKIEGEHEKGAAGAGGSAQHEVDSIGAIPNVGEIIHIVKTTHHA